MEPRNQAPPTQPPPAKVQKSIQELQIEATQETIKLVKWKMSILSKYDLIHGVMDGKSGELKSLTLPLEEQLRNDMAELLKLQQEEATYKNANRGLMAGAGEDCAIVKSQLALLWIDAPALNADAKKPTQADKEAWMRLQRTENKELAGLITNQMRVLAGIEDFRINIENAKRKVDVDLAIMRGRTAQIEFLGRSI
jgi:hypothetical protein